MDQPRQPKPKGEPKLSRKLSQTEISINEQSRATENKTEQQKRERHERHERRENAQNVRESLDPKRSLGVVEEQQNPSSDSSGRDSKKVKLELPDQQGPFIPKELKPKEALFQQWETIKMQDTYIQNFRNQLDKKNLKQQVLQNLKETLQHMETCKQEWKETKQLFDTQLSSKSEVSSELIDKLSEQTEAYYQSQKSAKNKLHAIMGWHELVDNPSDDLPRLDDTTKLAIEERKAHWDDYFKSQIRELHQLVEELKISSIKDNQYIQKSIKTDIPEAIELAEPDKRKEAEEDLANITTFLELAKMTFNADDDTLNKDAINVNRRLKDFDERRTNVESLIELPHYQTSNDIEKIIEPFKHLLLRSKLIRESYLNKRLDAYKKYSAVQIGIIKNLDELLDRTLKGDQMEIGSPGTSSDRSPESPLFSGDSDPDISDLEGTNLFADD